MTSTVKFQLEIDDAAFMEMAKILGAPTPMAPTPEMRSAPAQVEPDVIQVGRTEWATVRQTLNERNNEVQNLARKVETAEKARLKIAEKFTEAMGVFSQFQAQPSLRARVVEVYPTKLLLLAKGERIEVERPTVELVLSGPVQEDTDEEEDSDEYASDDDDSNEVVDDETGLGVTIVPVDYAVGDEVRISAQTMAILSKVEVGERTGEIVVLKSVSEDKRYGEIDRTGSPRRIVLPMPCEASDRVVVDMSATMALENLGADQGACVFGEATNVRWEDIGGLAEAKRLLREAVEGPVLKAAQFARFGKRPTRGVLLFGPPGNGKTLLGKATATSLAELHGKESSASAFHYVKGPELLNMYVGNTEANIRAMFDGARRHKKRHGFPAVIFIDEADAILGLRGGMRGMGGGMERTIVPQFLAEMDGLEDTGAIVLLATNRPDVLDPAVVRDGRIDRRIRVGRPTPEDAKEILTRVLASRPLGMDVEEATGTLVSELYSKRYVLAKIVRESKGMLTDKLTLSHVLSGAMLVGVVERAVSAALSRDAEVVEEYDLKRAVVETFNESLDVNYMEDLAEFCVGFIPDVKDIQRGTPLDVHASKS